MSNKRQKSGQSDELTASIRQAFESKLKAPIPEFDAVWAAAQEQVHGEKRRYRVISAIAASIAVLTIILSLVLPRQSQELADSELADAMMISVQWIAPSDILLPEYAFDIYQDVPELIHPTDMTRGLLL